MPKTNWPNSGFNDFATGISSAAGSGDLSIKRVLSGVLDDVDETNAKVDSAMRAGVNLLVNGISTMSEGVEKVPDKLEPWGGSSKGEAVVKEAKKHLGKAYVWGAEGPDHFDCSGLVTYCYKKAAKFSITHQSESQWNDKRGKKVLGQSPSAKDLKEKPLPGDLVFYSTPSNIHHVAICLGNNTGKMIEAPYTGKDVRIRNLSDRSDIAGVRRYLPVDKAAPKDDGGEGSGGGGGAVPGPYKSIKKLDLLVTNFFPLEEGSDPDMEGLDTTASGGKIRIDRKKPLGYTFNYQGKGWKKAKIYYYVLAVPEDNPLIPWVGWHKNPKYGVVFDGHPNQVFIAFDHYGDPAKRNSCDVLCYSKWFEKWVKTSRYGSGNNGIGSAHKCRATLVDLSVPTGRKMA